MGYGAAADAVPPDLEAALDGLCGRVAAAGGRIALCCHHLERGQGYARRADEVFPAASTIKVPILVALYDAAARGTVRLDRRVRLRSEDQVTGSGSLQLLSPGVRLPVRDLAELMIATSDNAATNVLLRLLGCDAVNACLQGLGLSRTRVHRPLQVMPAAPGPGNTVTAGELGGLLAGIAAGRVVSWEACRRMLATLLRQQVRTGLPALLPEPAADQAPYALPAWALAHKTGGYAGVQHDAGVLYLPGQTIALAVLTAGCGPAPTAQAIVAEAGRAVFDAYR